MYALVSLRAQRRVLIEWARFSPGFSRNIYTNIILELRLCGTKFLQLLLEKSLSFFELLGQVKILVFDRCRFSVLHICQLLFDSGWVRRDTERFDVRREKLFTGLEGLSRIKVFAVHSGGLLLLHLGELLLGGLEGRWQRELLLSRL